MQTCECTLSISFERWYCFPWVMDPDVQRFTCIQWYNKLTYWTFCVWNSSWTILHSGQKSVYLSKLLCAISKQNRKNISENSIWELLTLSRFLVCLTNVCWEKHSWNMKSAWHSIIKRLACIIWKPVLLFTIKDMILFIERESVCAGHCLITGIYMEIRMEVNC